jgi:hypothetical protein
MTNSTKKSHFCDTPDKYSTRIKNRLERPKTARNHWHLAHFQGFIHSQRTGFQHIEAQDVVLDHLKNHSL